MPNLDHRGPEGNGPQTGKQLGTCKSTISDNELVRRVRLHKKGCKGKSQNLLNSTDFRNIDVIGIKKKCKKKHN
jgi:hypothetical protein